MKLADIARVAQLNRERDDLIEKVSDASLPSGMNVTIRSAYQDEGMVAAVRPAVLAELGRRLAVIETELKLLGVELPEEQQS